MGHRQCVMRRRAGGVWFARPRDRRKKKGMLHRRRETLKAVGGQGPREVLCNDRDSRSFGGIWHRNRGSGDIRRMRDGGWRMGTRGGRRRFEIGGGRRRREPPASAAAREERRRWRPATAVRAASSWCTQRAQVYQVPADLRYDTTQRAVLRCAASTTYAVLRSE